MDDIDDDADVDGGVSLIEAGNYVLSSASTSLEDEDEDGFFYGQPLATLIAMSSPDLAADLMPFGLDGSSTGSETDAMDLEAVPNMLDQHLLPPVATVFLNQPGAPQLGTQQTLQAIGNPLDDLPPVQLSNTNPNVLGSQNHDLASFLRMWASHVHDFSRFELPQPRLGQALSQCRNNPRRIEYHDLAGDLCDLQGLNWAAMGTTRAAARARRRRKHHNHTNRSGSDKLMPELGDEALQSSESFFRFRRIHIRQDIKLAHFQLRSVLACPSRSQAYYASPRGVNRIDLGLKKTELALNINEFPSLISPITTLDANHGVLFCGTFSGEYYIQSLDVTSNSNFVEGQITRNHGGITNHLRLHTPRRSASPVAAIASNDSGFRLMDVATETFISQSMYKFPLNCSAVSPDRRLRVMVGDSLNILVACAETGEILRELRGPRDFSFACDWSDDGWTIATAAQDRCIRIWDARRLCNSNGESAPVCSMRTEMGAARSLKFSPNGSGRPVLVAVEEVDFINVIDATTFTTKQTIDVFGEMGGAAFANDGQDLNVICGDKARGGLLQLERCGRDFRSVVETPGHGERPLPHAWAQTRLGATWSPRNQTDSTPRPRRRISWDQLAIL